MQLGDTYYIPGTHLWVVISDPSKHSGCCVVVNITGDVFRAGKDCVLNVGDHKWIVKKSYISYGDALLLRPKEIANLQRNIASGTIKTHSPLTGAVLARIIAAGKVSGALAEHLKGML